MRARLMLAATAGVAVAVACLGPPVETDALVSAPPARPNIVFILLDDFSTEIMQYMDSFTSLAAQGVSFDSYITSNPLCCPSRSSILTGKYPHNTGVHDNYWPEGGVNAFLATGQEQRTVGVYLSSAGYRTGFIGKFLNGYSPAGGGGTTPDEPTYPANYVPPGWNEWFATGDAYQSFNYAMVSSVDGAARRVAFQGGQEADYSTDVMATRAAQFISDNAAGPFALLVNPFAVHDNPGLRVDPDTVAPPRYPPAPRDRTDSTGRPADWAPTEFADGDCGLAGGGCPGVGFPDPSWGRSFNTKPANAPTWYDDVVVAPPSGMPELRQSYIERIQMAQAADDLIEEVVESLRSSGVLDRTYVIVTSDNGYHVGQHGLGQGKSTPYDHDVRVPLVVRPPGGLTAARVSNHLVQNTDFLPTFLDIAGVTSPSDVDGESFAAELTERDSDENPGREAALVEFWRDETFDGAGVDPDRERALATIPPTYHAIRTSTYLYVDYSTLDATPPAVGRAELYDLRADPDEMTNRYASLTEAERADLNAALQELATCAGESCHRAASHAPAVS